jgi:SAM-dependent methyltransferase
MTNAQEWQGRVGISWAREWTRTDLSFAGLTRELVSHIQALAPTKLLDIGCGAGELSLAMAQHCPSTEILGIDISANLVAQAQSRLALGMENCRFAQADASCWQDRDFMPDVLMSRHGVMFFDNPEAAFSQLARASAPHASLVFSCFRDRAINPWSVEMAKLLPVAAPSDPHAPGPFAFADTARVQDILQAAGWCDIDFQPVDWDYITGNGGNAVEESVAFFTHIGPAAARLATIDNVEKSALLDKIRILSQTHLQENQVVFKAAAWIVTARKA